MQINKKMLVFVVLVLVAFPGCGGSLSDNPERDIVGSWETNDGSFRLDVTEDGQLNVVSKHGAATSETNSELNFLDETHILGIWEMMPRVWQVQIRGDNLTLAANDGTKLKLRRVK